MTEEKKQFNNKVDASFKDRVDEHLEMIDKKYRDLHISGNTLVQKSVSFALDYFEENRGYPWE